MPTRRTTRSEDNNLTSSMTPHWRAKGTCHLCDLVTTTKTKKIFKTKTTDISFKQTVFTSFKALTALLAIQKNTKCIIRNL